MKQLPLPLKRVLSLFPSKLPVSMPKYEAFVNDIIELAGQYADRDSMTWAISNMVIHLPAGTASVPKNHFVRNLRKAAANQIASQVFMDIKTKQEAAQLEAAKLKQAEATTAETTPASGQS